MIGRMLRSSSRHQVTSVASPNVQIMAMPVPLSGSCQLVGDDRHLDVEQRRAHGAAEQRLVALVVGVRHQGDTGRQQLGAGGVDHHVAEPSLLWKAILW